VEDSLKEEVDVCSYRDAADTPEDVMFDELEQPSVVSGCPKNNPLPRLCANPLALLADSEDLRSGKDHGCDHIPVFAERREDRG
jgi:hypothetical protein